MDLNGGERSEEGFIVTYSPEWIPLRLTVWGLM